MSTPQWTTQHRFEALRRLYELAGEYVIRNWHDVDKIDELIENAKREEWFRRALLRDLGLKPKRIEREVWRVRGLAEGRLVRETVWRARDPQWAAGNIDHEGGSDPRADALMTIKGMGKGWRLVKVTRICRAVPQ